MKTVVIGDIHGRDLWKDILIKEQPDKTIFVGDYLDSFDISVARQLSNFADIIAFKRNNSSNVVLLIGNHDYHYTSMADERYSGFEAETYLTIRSTMDELVRTGVIEACHKQDKFLFSHAGITRTWATLFDLHPDEINFVEQVNDLLVYQGRKFRFLGGDYYGEDITQSPIWVRPKSLNEDKIPGFVHVVGHTYQETLKIGEGIIFIDTLPNGQYLIIEDNVPRIGTL